MTPEQIRESAELLDLLVIKLGRATERHHGDCACHACTALIGASLAHSHLLALLEAAERDRG
jgi:hypothetical protein